MFANAANLREARPGKSKNLNYKLMFKIVMLKLLIAALSGWVILNLL
jgi:hypothetical protein